MSWIELTATIFGLICVLLTIRQNIWCWPAGLVQVVLYIFVFAEAKLYSDVLLHIIYIFLSLYGWYCWLKGGKEINELIVSQLNKLTIPWILICSALSLIAGFAMRTFTDAALPFPDAFIMISSPIAQWLMARKKLESWFFWIAADIVAIAVYSIKELYFTSALYFIFLILAMAGYIQWNKTILQPNSEPIASEK